MTITLPARPKLAMFDVDGTLMNSQQEISTASLQAIKKLQDAGIACGLATGRNYSGAIPVIEQLGIDAPSMILAGAFIFESQSRASLFESIISPSDIHSLMELCSKRSWYLELFTAKGIFTERRTKETEIHMEYQHLEPQYLPFSEIADNQKLLKAELIISEETEYQAVMEAAKDFPTLSFTPARSTAHPGFMFINITSIHGSRENAFQQILDINKVSAEEMISFGDSEGDKVFIESAGVGVAMGNAPNCVKSTADFVTKHVDEDGVAFAIEIIVQKI